MLNNLYKEEIDLIKQLKGEINTAEVGDNIKKRQFTMTDVGISSRLLNHWEKSGLLMDGYEERKWKKFNLIEYTWLKIVSELRKYDLSHEIIRKAKLSLLKEYRIDDLPDKELFYEAIKKITPENKIEEVQRLLESVEMKTQIGDFQINFLEIVINYVILLKRNFSLLVNLKGECIPLKYANIEEYAQFDEFHEFLSGSYISISITNILKEFLIKNEIASPKKKISLLSEAESQVIRTIRDDEVKSVKIIKNASEQIDIIEEIRTGRVEKEARIMDLILSHGYQTIEIKTQNGSIVHCENKIKKRIDKVPGTA
jgi:DNA-binding transcriptional MerR regulator